MDIGQVTTFLGWCTAINGVVLVLAALGILGLRDLVGRVHGTMFGLPQVILAEQYFQYLAQYKLLIIVFNLAPYLALRIMGP